MDYELSEDEILWVKSNRRLSPEVREFLKERGGPEEVGKMASINAKVAMDAKAEADAIYAVRDRRAALGEGADAADWRTRAITAESRLKDKAMEIEDLERQKLQAIAQNSMAVNSTD